MASMTARLTEVPDPPSQDDLPASRTPPTRRSGCCGSGSSSPRSCSGWTSSSTSSSTGTATWPHDIALRDFGLLLAALTLARLATAFPARQQV
jgi:hypothetical protein